MNFCSYCQEHKKKITHLRKQAIKTKRRSSDTLESMVYELERNNEEVVKSEMSTLKNVPKTISNLHQTDGISCSNAKYFIAIAFIVCQYLSFILVCQSDSDSDKEPIPMEDIFRGDAESEPESLDSDQEDPLKY